MIQHSVHVWQNSSIRPPRQSDHLNRSQRWSDWLGFTVLRLEVHRDIFKCSFSFSGAEAWSKIPISVRQLTTFNVFKDKFKRFIIKEVESIFFDIILIILYNNYLIIYTV